MKLLFRQRIFSWLDSYDIYDENQNVVYSVKGKLSFGHCLYIYDINHYHIGTIKEEVLRLLPRFKMYINDQYIGEIYKELTFFKPKYHVECNGWSIHGDIFEWDYEVVDNYQLIARISKELWHLSDTYVLDIQNNQDALYVLMIVLAIDAEKCSRDS
ncbi:MAG: LURP-one-related family protein [Erysipelotrichaceae bacterium]|nr:LURP-one-related family protein [Erysipelotrichaceae bacterium]